MDYNKANAIAKLMNEINKCKNFIKCLTSESDSDNFEISYQGLEVCDLEIEAKDILIDYYKDKMQCLEKILGEY